MKKSRAVELLAQKLEWAEDCAESLAMEDEYDRDLHHEWEEEAEALRMAIKALKREEWIPVAERLPEEGQPVLVQRIRGREKRVEQGEKAEGDWWRIYGTRTKKAEAWMSLPEPYGGDKP